MAGREASRAHVLIVDDDPDTRAMSAEALHDRYDVGCAAAAGEALGQKARVGLRSRLLGSGRPACFRRLHEGIVLMSRNGSFVVPATIVILVLCVTPAHAYTDPGTGALIWQMLLAASVGVMFYARRMVSWVRALMNRRPAAGAAGPLSARAEGESPEAGR